MNKFDLIFLLIGSSSASRLDSFFSLYNSAFSAGFNTVIATSPKDLKPDSYKSRVVVVDAHYLDTEDLLETKDCLSNLLNTNIIFLTRNTETEKKLFENKIIDENNMCLPFSIGFRGLKGLLAALSQ